MQPIVRLVLQGECTSFSTIQMGLGTSSCAATRQRGTQCNTKSPRGASAQAIRLYCWSFCCFKCSLPYCGYPVAKAGVTQASSCSCGCDRTCIHCKQRQLRRCGAVPPFQHNMLCANCAVRRCSRMESITLNTIDCNYSVPKGAHSCNTDSESDKFSPTCR